MRGKAQSRCAKRGAILLELMPEWNYSSMSVQEKKKRQQNVSPALPLTTHKSKDGSAMTSNPSQIVLTNIHLEITWIPPCNLERHLAVTDNCFTIHVELSTGLDRCTCTSGIVLTNVWVHAETGRSVGNFSGKGRGMGWWTEGYERSLGGGLVGQHALDAYGEDMGRSIKSRNFAKLFIYSHSSLFQMQFKSNSKVGYSATLMWGETTKKRSLHCQTMNLLCVLQAKVPQHTPLPCTEDAALDCARLQPERIHGKQPPENALVYSTVILDTFVR